MEKEHHYNTTVMFVDMENYTSKIAKLSRKEIQKILEEFEAVVKPAVGNFGGKIIKGIGDAFLITFHSPTNSVLCGIEIQKRIEDRNQKREQNEKFMARIGICSGEVYERGGDIFGEPVNLASRIQSLAKGGQVIFSSSTFHAMNKNEFSTISLGKKTIKGISEKIEVYLAHEKGKRPFIKKLFTWKKLLIAAGILFLLLLLLSTNKGPKELGNNWNERANSAIANNNERLMKNLLETFENSPQEKKTLESMILAAKMYYALGMIKDARRELENAYNKADEEQKQKILDALEERGFITPEKIETELTPE